MRTLLFVVLSLIMIKSFSCDCKTITKSDELKISEFVFIGEVIAISDTCFELSVIETFKGVLEDTVLFVIADCSILPKKTEIWLIYANKFDSISFLASQCGWSRSSNWPFSGNSRYFPKPPPLNLPETDLEILNLINTEMALLELHFDIQDLRHKSTQNKLEDIRMLILENIESVNCYQVLMKWVYFMILFVLIITIGVLLVKLRIR